jgi:ABC-type amino acid transport substrate-binding protein
LTRLAGEQYGLALSKGSALVRPVSAALRSLPEDGSVDGLSRQWLTFDPRNARILG